MTYPCRCWTAALVAAAGIATPVPYAGAATALPAVEAAPQTSVAPKAGADPVRFASGPLNASTYTNPGPTSITGGQVENVSPNNPTNGAAQVILPHPTDANILYVGFTNGGIWQTTNATDPSPTWTPQTDSLGSLSIGAVAFDLADATNQTLYAGIGRYSTLGRIGGSRIGLIRTTNGGTTWSVVSSALAGRNISSLAVRGSTVVAAIDVADNFTYSNIGIFRSINSGSNFTQISGTSGLPQGICYDMATDPSTSTTLYTSVALPLSGTAGVYKSTDTGANWTLVSNSAMNTRFTNNTSNVKISVGTANNVYVGIVNSGILNSVWRSGDGGGTWAQMDTPGTMEGANFYGIHPAGQGAIHFSMTADPSNSNVMYIGGDRQPRGNELAGPSFPNSIGATNTSGRLFRGDASTTPGSQWVPLTHSNSVAAFPGGGTASNSAPRATSRDMAVDAAGRLIEADGGGVYVRTNPTSNTGDWFGLHGNAVCTEIHDVAYDSVSDKLIAGTIDVGVVQQSSSGGWETVVQDDGGDVAVDDVSLAGSGQSIRYSSRTNFSGLTRRTYDATGTLLSSTPCTLTGLTGSVRYVTTIQLNHIDPNRLLFGMTSNLLETLNRGNSVSSLGTVSSSGDTLSGVGLDYGGKSGGIDNADVLYAVRASIVYVRTAAPPTALTSTTISGSPSLLDVVMDRNDYNTAYCVSSTNVYKSTNTGTSWTVVTGDLGSVGAIRCIEFIPTANGGTVVIGTATGVYVAKNSAPTLWYRLGTNMPAAAYVFDLEYNETDNVLVAGTLGRGVWVMPNANSVATVPVTMSAWEIH